MVTKFFAQSFRNCAGHLASFTIVRGRRERKQKRKKTRKRNETRHLPKQKKQMEEEKKRKLEEINKDMAVGVFDAEVEERVSVMKIELESLCGSMKSTITLELTRVCSPPSISFLLKKKKKKASLLEIISHKLKTNKQQLPPKIRKMKAREFFQTFKGDIVEALRSGGASSIKFPS